MGIFGWSYPPGAASDPNAPYNQVDPPCQLCGKFEDKCECPECSECGEIGCIEHLRNSDLIDRMNLAHDIYSALKREYDKRLDATMVECKKCKTKTYACIESNIPNYCPQCKVYLHGDGSVYRDYDFEAYGPEDTDTANNEQDQ